MQRSNDANANNITEPTEATCIPLPVSSRASLRLSAARRSPMSKYLVAVCELGNSTGMPCMAKYSDGAAGLSKSKRWLIR
eukprot:3562421-Pyramimonas_sp.AAC.1